MPTPEEIEQVTQSFIEALANALLRNDRAFTDQIVSLTAEHAAGEPADHLDEHVARAYAVHLAQRLQQTVEEFKGST